MAFLQWSDVCSLGEGLGIAPAAFQQEQMYSGSVPMSTVLVGNRAEPFAEVVIRTRQPFSLTRI
jgi:hypothetical protein